MTTKARKQGSLMEELPADVAAFVDAHLVDRRNSNAVKWDGLKEEFGRDDLLPMWIADTEFKAPQAVLDALTARVQEGTFGYSIRPQSYYDAFINWQKERHGVTVEPEWMRFGVGVVKSLYAMVNWLTDPGDPVLIMQPVYYPFMNAIKDLGRRVVSVDLQLTADGWRMDFDQLEKTLATTHIKAMILCSPHNPVGRIWTRDELNRLFAITSQHDITVVSDEIHGDLEVSGPKFTSALQVAEGKARQNLVVLNAPSKTFNLAALLNSHIIIPDEELRAKYDDFIKQLHPVDTSLMGQVAGEAAYRHGAAWLDQVLQVVRFNYRQLLDGLAQAAPKATVADLQGTYLAYVDIGAYVAPDHIKAFVEGICGLAVDYGAWFSPKTATYIRLNLATDPKLVAKAITRLTEHLSQPQL
jgi:cystathionine beta-lyase